MKCFFSNPPWRLNWLWTCTLSPSGGCSKAVLWLGQLRLPCSEEQLQALVELLTNSLVFGHMSSWGTDVFIDIGVLAGIVHLLSLPSQLCCVYCYIWLISIKHILFSWPPLKSSLALSCVFLIAATFALFKCLWNILLVFQRVCQTWPCQHWWKSRLKELHLWLSQWYHKTSLL